MAIPTTLRGRQYKAKVDFRKIGKLERPRIREGIIKAQAENARVAERMVRSKAQALIKHNNVGPTRRRSTPMVSAYRARTLQDPRVLSLTNPTRKAWWFEYGVKPHRITPRTPGGRLAWQDQGGWHYSTRVRHPGQRATNVMTETMTGLAPTFEKNIDREIGREIG